MIQQFGMSSCNSGIQNWDREPSQAFEACECAVNLAEPYSPLLFTPRMPPNVPRPHLHHLSRPRATAREIGGGAAARRCDVMQPANELLHLQSGTRTSRVILGGCPCGNWFSRPRVTPALRRLLSNSSSGFFFSAILRPHFDLLMQARRDPAVTD